MTSTTYWNHHFCIPICSPGDPGSFFWDAVCEGVRRENAVGKPHGDDVTSIKVQFYKVISQRIIITW
jgi:hypothetical protein